MWWRNKCLRSSQQAKLYVAKNFQLEWDPRKIRQEQLQKEKEELESNQVSNDYRVEQK